MKVTVKYHRTCSDSVLVIDQLVSPEEIRINNHIVSSSSLPGLAIIFELSTHERCLSKVPHDRIAFERIYTKSFRLQLCPSVYLSYDVFYRAMREKFDNLGEEFDKNYCHVVIHDMIGKVGEIVHDESNRGRQNLKLFVRVVSVADQWTLLEEPSASKSSILQLLNGMKVDENIIKDHCTICFEEHGKERDLQCMPCSHIFHGDCITTWLKHGHSCPICRYDFLKS